MKYPQNTRTPIFTYIKLLSISLLLNVSLQPQKFKSLRQVVNNTVPTSYVRQQFEKAKKKYKTKQKNGSYLRTAKN